MPIIGPGFDDPEYDNYEMYSIAAETGTTIDEVRAAHKADLADWAREQQLRDHPELAVLDADLDRVARRNQPAAPPPEHGSARAGVRSAARGSPRHDEGRRPPCGLPRRGASQRTPRTCDL